MRTILSSVVCLFLLGAAQARACDGIRLETDMRCCLMLTCSERPGSKSVLGAVKGPPNSQGLFNLRRGFKACQRTDETNNFYSCERQNKKGPYNVGRRILGLPPG